MGVDIHTFTRMIYQLMDKGQHNEAQNIILEKLKEIEPCKEGNIILLAEIAGFLIDIGSEKIDERAAQMGISIMEENRPSSKDE